MKKKKGKVLALELVDDLLAEGSSESNELQSLKTSTEQEIELAKTEVLPLNSQTTSSRTDLTTKLTDEELSQFEMADLEIPQPSKTTSSLRTHAGARSQTELNLDHSMNLKRAQEKILDLESMIEDLRRENEKLHAASQTFKKHGDELQVRVSDLQLELSSLKDQAQDEKKLLMSAIDQKERSLDGERLEKEQLQSRLNSNLKKIRVRERELENRLEIVRLENFSLQRSKDEHILGLKRQIDEIDTELESYRDKAKYISLELQKKKQMLRKTVKALRLALTLLESDEKDLKVAANGD